ncbi:ribonuclease P subunit P14 [Salinarchaeum sp. Harcht-Bsk1]|uniref:Rpp14/Pop5 family protein n=1 Tax=Salinarchaeum sp. Harcht-Bsk1 TaxID=1333523 RepID=UPI0003424779|nr:Rpp14/Pop5 family protein [Salinarchaeum sp. Harcht-Bsk1]AGN01971.1 ribonuclease P subunit P14 [Salinarchaeum sp. Harcht-Bsk1]
MKHLPKHLRPRYRYLAVGLESWPDASFDRRAFQREVWDATRALCGDPGSAAIDPTVLRFDRDGSMGRAILKVRRGTVDRARAALACIDAVGGDAVGLRVRGTSGTVRACEEKYLGGPPEPSEERTVVYQRQERTATVRSPRVDVRTDAGFLGATESDCDRTDRDDTEPNCDTESDRD